MVAHENVFKGTKIKNIKGREELLSAMFAKFPVNLTSDEVVFVCIGTDRSTGDALGPLVGTLLERLGYENVVGTLDDPTHAVNLTARIQSLPKDKVIVAVDASLGREESVRTFSVYNGSIKPGAGVGKRLPEVGNYSVTGVVNIGGFMEYQVLQNTSLSVVMNMAEDIVSAISEVFPLKSDIYYGDSVAYHRAIS